jgi:hypothetical protein
VAVVLPVEGATTVMTLVADPVLNGNGNAWPRTTVGRAEAAGAGATGAGRGGFAACGREAGEPWVASGARVVVPAAVFDAVGVAVRPRVSNVGSGVAGTGLIAYVGAGASDVPPDKAGSGATVSAALGIVAAAIPTTTAAQPTIASITPDVATTRADGMVPVCQEGLV